MTRQTITIELELKPHQIQYNQTEGSAKPDPYLHLTQFFKDYGYKVLDIKGC